MHKNEVGYAKKISDIIYEKFNIKGTISFEENKLSLEFSGKILKKLFSNLCKCGAKNKRIPKILFNKRLLPYVIEGLYLGDGHFNKQGWSLSTASRQLANDVMLALTKMKKKFNFNIQDFVGKERKGGFISRSPIHAVNYKLNNPNVFHSNKSWFVEGGIAFLIKDIKKEKYKGKVCNLEVEDDNSYTTSAFCVHNCLFEAYASGLPVIGSAVNGVPYELEDGINGFLLPSSSTDKFIKQTNLLLDNGGLRGMMSFNNKAKAKGFDWDIITKRTMEVYKQ